MRRLLLPLLLLLSACQGQSPGFVSSVAGDGIIGGTDVKPTEIETRRVHLLEKIVYDQSPNGDWIPSRRGLCSIGLIGRRLALAAAHCVLAEGTRGTLNLFLLRPDGFNKRIAVVDWQVHDSADLAVLKLGEDAPSSAEILNLPREGKTYSVAKIEAAGYGRMDGHVNNEGNTGVLRKTVLQTEGYDPKQSVFRVDQTRGRGFCQGDSGGPGLITDGGKKIVIGIASQTAYIENPGDTNVDKCSRAGIYMNVPYYLKWIRGASAGLLSVRTPPPSLMAD